MKRTIPIISIAIIMKVMSASVQLTNKTDIQNFTAELEGLAKTNLVLAIGVADEVDL